MCTKSGNFSNKKCRTTLIYNSIIIIRENKLKFKTYVVVFRELKYERKLYIPYRTK